MKTRTAARISRRTPWGFLAVALLVILTAPGMVDGAGAKALFKDDQGQIASETSKRRTTMRGRRVKVDLGALAGAGIPSGASSVDLNLFADKSHKAVKRHFEGRDDRHFAWTGSVPDDPASLVVLVAHDGLMAGSIFAHGKHYFIQGADAASQEVVEIDQSAFPNEACDFPAADAAPTAPAAPAALPADAQADSGATINVMVVYTPAARVSAGGTTAMVAKTILAVDETNASYANSGIVPRLNLANVEEISYTESGNTLAAIQTDLGRLQSNGDGYMDNVHTLRGYYLADVVVLLTNQTAYCGLASAVMASESTAFAIVAQSCATGIYSFGHEIGHLQGARHDRFVDAVDGPNYAYNHGHYHTASRQRTVMAYNDACVAAGTSCTRLAYWSNPAVAYPGTAVAMGSVDHEFNAQVLNNTAYTVANFRAAAPSNAAPTDIALSPASVAENLPSATTVGTLSTNDPDVGNTFTYTLVAGTGSADNVSFSISGNLLQTAASFDFEGKSSYSVRVRTTDQGALWFEKAFTVTVINANEAPADIALSPATVAERQPAGATVGSLSTTDPDAGNTFTYALVAGTGSADNGSFTISGATLLTNDVLFYDSKSSYSIRVRSTDQGALWYEKVLTITVVAVPCTYGVSPPSVSLPANAGLGSLGVTTQLGCTWTAAKSDGWITITAGASGSGSGVVLFSVASNAGASPRSGNILVAGTSVAITQAAQPLTASFVGNVGGTVYDNPFGPPTLGVTFDAGGSRGPAPITNYHWVFGDGATADTAAATIVHNYPVTGSYPVTLTVTGGAQTDSTQRLVTVADQVHYVDTAAELQAALTAAQSNAGHDLIRVAAGTYPLTANGGVHFSYLAAAGENKDLVLEGGWAPDFSRRAYNLPTVLQGNPALPPMTDGGVLSLDGATNGTTGSFTVDGVAVAGGSATGSGGGLFAVNGGSVSLSNGAVADNTAGGTGGGVYLQSGGGAWVTNCAISGNQGAAAGAGLVQAAYAYVYANALSGNTATAHGGLQAQVAAGGELIVSNNTIYANQAASGSAGLTVGSSGSSGTTFLDVHNNIVYGNTGGAPDFTVVPDCAYLLNYVALNVVGNDLGTFSMCADYPLDPSNVAVSPWFVSNAATDFRLRSSDTLLIDAGTNLAVPAEDFEGDALPLDGGSGSAIADIGADEYNPANATGPTAISIAPSNPAIATLSGSATLTVSLDHAAKRDLVLYLTHADTNVDSPGQPLVTVEPPYLKIHKGTTGAVVTVQALSTARHGTALITASDPSGSTAPGSATATVSVNPPGALTLVSPAGAVGTTTPTYVWYAQTGVDSYQLWVGTGTTTALSAWYTAAAAGCAAGTGSCSVTPATALAAGSWFFNVKAKNAVGTGPWTTSKNFLVPAVPTALTLVSPAGTVATPTPLYRWNAQAGVDSYQLWVGTGTTTAFSAWYTAAAAGCATGTGTCSVTPATALAEGTWFFNVKGKNFAGTGPWTSAKSFTYSLVAVPTPLTLAGPSGAAGTTTPTYSWSAQSGVDSYQLWVGTGSSTALSVTYPASAAGCGTGIGTCAVTPATPLPAGTWYFNVKGINLAGSGPWGSAKSFSTP